jgi:hypothetical protein
VRIAAVALLLTGCTTIEYRDRIVYETVEVPVPVSCVSVLPEAVKLEQAGPTDYEKIRAIVIDRENLISQEQRLLAILTACR